MGNTLGASHSLNIISFRELIIIFSLLDWYSISTRDNDNTGNDSGDNDGANLFLHGDNLFLFFIVPLDKYSIYYMYIYVNRDI